MAARMGRQIACALNHMHANGVTHRDVKLENILVMASTQRHLILKIADFGAAIKTQDLLYTPTGSPG